MEEAEDNLENIDPESRTKGKGKRKVLRKVKRRKSKKVEDEDNEMMQNYQVCME